MPRSRRSIGSTGIAFYLAARGLGFNLTVVPEALPDVWWKFPVLILSAVQNAVLEEVIVVGYLLRRLGQLGWTPGTALVASSVLRGSYHLYQGIGGFVGNMAMGVVFVYLYRRWGRVGPAGGGALAARHRRVRRIRAARGQGGVAADGVTTGAACRRQGTTRVDTPCRSAPSRYASRSPSMTVTAWPVSRVRSPRSSVRTRPERGEACRPVSSARPRRSDQNGARAVWALPVTGSSSMPTFGKKQRETKS